jgi:hypothetical protein
VPTHNVGSFVCMPENVIQPRVKGAERMVFPSVSRRSRRVFPKPRQTWAHLSLKQAPSSVSIGIDWPLFFIPALNVNHGTSLLGSFDWVGALVSMCV